MDRFPLEFVLIVALYFALLHLLILPILQMVSRRIQGTGFTHRLQAGATSKTKSGYEKYDLAWSFFANFIALALSFTPLWFINELEWF